MLISIPNFSSRSLRDGDCSLPAVPAARAEPSSSRNAFPAHTLRWARILLVELRPRSRSGNIAALRAKRGMIQQHGQVLREGPTGPHAEYDNKADFGDL